METPWKPLNNILGDLHKGQESAHGVLLLALKAFGKVFLNSNCGILGPEFLNNHRKTDQ